MDSQIVIYTVEEEHIITPNSYTQVAEYPHNVCDYWNHLDPDIKYACEIRVMTLEETRESRFRVAQLKKRMARKRFILGILWALMGPSA